MLYLITVKATFISEYLKYPEPCLTILPFEDIVPDSIMPGSKPAKDNIFAALENLETSPNSEMIEAQEITPIPGIDRVGGLRSLIIVEICLSNSII